MSHNLSNKFLTYIASAGSAKARKLEHFETSYDGQETGAIIGQKVALQKTRLVKQLCGNSSSVEGEKAIAMSAFVMIHGPSIAIFNPTQSSSSPALFCTNKKNPSAFNEQIEIGKM